MVLVRGPALVVREWSVFTSVSGKVPTMTALIERDTSTNAAISEQDKASVFHSWSAQGSLNPLPLAGGLGSTVWDHDGKRYLDFSSQLVFTNLGHQHPKIVAAITEQVATLATVAPAHANATRARAAELITERAPEGFNKIFFTNGGADANENAIRMARLTTGRDKIISRYRSYHGNTGAAIVATGDWRRIPNEYATVTSTSSAPTCTAPSSGPRPRSRSPSGPCTISSG